MLDLYGPLRFPQKGKANFNFLIPSQPQPWPLSVKIFAMVPYVQHYYDDWMFGQGELGFGKGSGLW